MRLFRKSRRRKSAASKRNSVRLRVAVLRHPQARKRKILEINRLGRLDALKLSRSVPDNRFGELNLYHKKYPNKNLDKPKNLRHNSINLRFDLDSEICKARKERRKEIMKKTRGRGMRVKNALWNVASFIQCRD